MIRKPVEIDRASYKKIKNMNREQLSAFLTEIYSNGMKESMIDYDELREVIGSVSGIGDTRLNLIMEAIESHYAPEDEGET